MCKLNEVNWGFVRTSRLLFREVPEPAPDSSEKSKKIVVEVMPELDQAKANVEAAKAQAKLINVEKKAEAMLKKEVLMSELVRKGASGEAMNAFEASYDPRIRDTVAKIIENARPAFNLHDPKSWEKIDAVLADKKSGVFYSQVYDKEYFPLAPLIAPKKPKEPVRMEEVAIIGKVDQPEKVSTAELNKAIDARLGAQLMKLREKMASKEAVAKTTNPKKMPVQVLTWTDEEGGHIEGSRKAVKSVAKGPSAEQLRKAGIDSISVWGTKLTAEGYPKSVVSQAMKNEEILNDPEKSLYSALFDAFEGKQNIEKGVALYRKFVKEKATDEVALEAAKLALKGTSEKEAMALASRKGKGTPGKGFGSSSAEVAKK